MGQGITLRRRVLLGAPVVLLLAIFVYVVATPSFTLRTHLPVEALNPLRCTWFCHNHGCPHMAKLPAWLTSDAGLFGQTIKALYGLGASISKTRGIGYGLANLLVYCVLWPTVTYALWTVVVGQGATLRRERAKKGSRP